MLLTADWHLDDKPENEYRWAVFGEVRRQLEKTPERHLVILGDLCDRRDKHSAALVNRLMDEFADLLAHHAMRIDILMGNHDAPVNGIPFWHILDHLANDRAGSFVQFHIEPFLDKGNYTLYLPFTPNPVECWAGIDLKKYKLAFIHQPIKGADAGGHILEEGSEMPLFPRGLKVYAGDIHYPQTIGKITYVGAPHRVRFGDDHHCRFLALEADGSAKEIELRAPQKAVAEVSSLEELQQIGLQQGDMARIRFAISANSIEAWPVEMQAIQEWATDAGIQLASIEAIVDNVREAISIPSFDTDPRLVLQDFCKQEGLDQGLIDAGMELLRK
jgi:hypothetical protein